MPPVPVSTKLASACGLGILGVVEVEHRRALAHAAGDGGDLAGDRVGRELAVLDQALEGEVQRHPGAGDGGGARAAVGLQHVAVDVDLALAQRRSGRPRRAASGRSGAGSPGCGPTACRARPRGRCGCGSSAAACRIRRSPSPGRCCAGRAAPAPRPRRCTAHGCRRTSPGTSPRHGARSPARGTIGRSWSGARPEGRMSSPDQGKGTKGSGLTAAGRCSAAGRPNPAIP